MCENIERAAEKNKNFVPQKTLDRQNNEWNFLIVPQTMRSSSLQTNFYDNKS